MNGNGKRSKRLDRILKVQREKRLIEEWRLSQLQQKRAEIDREDATLLESLGTDSKLHGFFIEARVKTLRRNDVVRRSNLDEQQKTQGVITGVRRAEKGVERLRETAQRHEGAQAESKTLEGSVDGYLARRLPSFD